MSETYYIGWDVGAWHCTTKSNNKKSKDAIAVLNESNTLGTWSGNLKDSINNSETTLAFIKELFKLCNIENIPQPKEIVLAIDAPLGFSDALNKLLIGEYPTEPISEYNSNPYLFRGTEMFLFEKGFSPLSSINHMIGSQTTKAMHVVAKFANQVISCGVWSDKEDFLTIIETYPAACESIKVKETEKIENTENNENKDLDDALICAKIAKMFDKNKDDLEQPQEGTSNREGWIWFPK